MNIDNLIKILEYCSHECLMQARDLELQDEFIVSMKYLGAHYAYDNIIRILKDEPEFNFILSQIKKQSEAQQ